MRSPANKKRLIDIAEERKYEGKYRGHVKDLGARIRKVEHKIEKGWPDTYAAPNFWIEFKTIRWYSENPISIWSHFDEQQKVMLRDLAFGGCECFIVVFWDCGYKGKWVQTIRYLDARQHERWSRDLMWPFSDRIEDLKAHVRSCWRVEREQGRLRLHSAAHEKTQLNRSAYPYLGVPRGLAEGD